MSSAEPTRQLHVKLGTRVFPGHSRTTSPLSPERTFILSVTWSVVSKFHTENKDPERRELSKERRKRKDESDRVPVQNFLDDSLHHRVLWVQTDFLLVLQGGSAETERGRAREPRGLTTRAEGRPSGRGHRGHRGAAHQHSHNFHPGALRAGGDHLHLSDHFGPDPRCGG